MATTPVRIAVALVATVFLAAAGHRLFVQISIKHDQTVCAANQKTLAAAIEMYSVDCSLLITRITHALVADLAAQGYMNAVPQDPGGGVAWESYYLDRGLPFGVGCRLHGALDATRSGLIVVPKTTPALPSGFSADREALTCSLHQPLKEIALSGPVTAAALEVPPLATVSVETLIEKTRHASPRTRAVAALALRRSRDPKVVPVLERLLEDPDPAVRKQAVWGLGYLADRSHGAAIRKLLADPADTVAAAAAMALARHCEADGVERCFEIVADSRQPVPRRVEAAWALTNLACVGGQGTVAGNAFFYETAVLDPAHPKRVGRLKWESEVLQRLRSTLAQTLGKGAPADLASGMKEPLAAVERSLSFR